MGPVEATRGEWPPLAARRDARLRASSENQRNHTVNPTLRKGSAPNSRCRERSANPSKALSSVLLIRLSRLRAATGDTARTSPLSPQWVRSWYSNRHH